MTAQLKNYSWKYIKQPDISTFIQTANNHTEKPNNITPEMINEEFQKLDTSKAPRPDGINNKIRSQRNSGRPFQHKPNRKLGTNAVERSKYYNNPEN